MMARDFRVIVIGVLEKITMDMLLLRVQMLTMSFIKLLLFMIDEFPDMLIMRIMIIFPYIMNK
jgi:hypothetical protein